MQAALNAYHKETPFTALPSVTLPRASPPRTRFLSRAEAARLLLATRKMEDKEGARGIRRFVLIGLYTGTRSGAIRDLGWMPNVTGGWIDLDRGIFHRRPEGEVETKKRKPSSRIPDRLADTLRRWRDADMNPPAREDGTTPAPIPFVIHYRGVRAQSQRKSWVEACRIAKLDGTVTPHILRHTAVTWMMLAGNDPYDVSSYVGMSVKMLDEVYGHHHPDHQKAIASKIGRR
ncbi:site-specific integrase [Aureimonas pseudogalii]|uniref:Integrase n=2 Tax=Aureimonas pseudogalii TaxID=1744844 RepID=A0A7W6H3K6_9HYPH|nr:site-specific integrase [Aureimonas pseudogalii]MBB3997262.1 integrase [Aureimonas pseudogalii]